MRMETQSLEGKIEAVEDKAERYARLENIDAKVTDADRELRELNRDINALQEELEELNHYTEVLNQVFTNEDHHQPASVDDAHARVRSALSESKSDLVTRLVSTDKTLQERRKKINQAKSEAVSAKNDVVEILEKIQKEWLSRIGSARGVLRIVGDSYELEDAMDKMETLLTKRMYRTSEEIEQLQADWERYRRTWEEEGIDWDKFQKDHGITDDTVDCLQELSRGEDKRLADVSDDVIEDLHRIKEIGSEIKLSL